MRQRVLHAHVSTQQGNLLMLRLAKVFRILTGVCEVLEYPYTPCVPLQLPREQCVHNGPVTMCHLTTAVLL